MRVGIAGGGIGGLVLAHALRERGVDVLVDARDLSERPAGDALATYRRRLLCYAPAAVAEAGPPLAWQRRFANPAIRLLGTTVLLPAADAVLRAGAALGRVRTG